MKDKQEEQKEEKIGQLEDKIDKTNERISALVGVAILGGPAILLGLSALPVAVLGGVGGVLGAGGHHFMKWVKGRNRVKKSHKE